MSTVTHVCVELFNFVTVVFTTCTCCLWMNQLEDHRIRSLSWVTQKDYFLSQNEMMYVGRCKQLCRQCPDASAVTNISV